MKRVCVLMGGTSNERAVSLESGRNVAEALASLNKYEVLPLLLDADNLVELPDGVDAAYIALHGGWGENGGVQAELNRRGIAYTGPGARASRIAMDKIETKKVLSAAGVATAPWRIVRPEDLPIEASLGLPCVVKVPRDGSSVGVYLVKTAEELRKALLSGFEIDSTELLMEKYLAGREMTVGVIDGEALPSIEIVAPNGWYGYYEKYKSDETRYPFLEDEKLDAKLREIALRAYNALGCRGVTRVDFRATEDGTPYVLELNTSPGFTSHSLVPKAGMKTGLSFAEVCDRILSCATID